MDRQEPTIHPCITTRHSGDYVRYDATPTFTFKPIRLLIPDCYKFTHLMANSADPDRLAYEEAKWSGPTLCKGRLYLGSAWQGLTPGNVHQVCKCVPSELRLACTYRWSHHSRHCLSEEIWIPGCQQGPANSDQIVQRQADMSITLQGGSDCLLKEFPSCESFKTWSFKSKTYFN